MAWRASPEAPGVSPAHRFVVTRGNCPVQVASCSCVTQCLLLFPPPPKKKTRKIQCMGLGSSCVVSPACLACGWWLPLSMGRWRRQRWWQHPHHQGAYRRNLGKPLGIPGNLFPSQATNHFSSPHSTRGTWQDAAKRSITTILRPRGKAAKIRLVLATARK